MNNIQPDILDIVFSNTNTKLFLKIEEDKKLKENEFKLLIQRTKDNKKKYLELVKETYKSCPHPTLLLIYSAYKYAEKFENIKRKKRTRKGLLNKSVFSFKYTFGK